MGDIAVLLVFSWILSGIVAELILQSLRKKKVNERRYLISATIARMLAYSTCLVGGGHGVMVLPTGMAILFALFRWGDYEIAPFPALLFVVLIFIFPVAIRIFTDSPSGTKPESVGKDDIGEKP